ncbi:hypothetical protein C483_10121 [Natrialba hulunbeirensis JCM 10989]|uniref:HVO-0234-like beta-propeller domain-containing protein n=1 Tax=Natrialba hulunbeirensis JCM 10989 TaxID=1227493 RepID=L9ZZN2_9EURY|nr:hypothetical protein [Natrialba hulunbeirensis]ELY91032.1 hypothetical protein C483_10121 [Natrialba hulunbeirensis JCM 10989]
MDSIEEKRVFGDRGGAVQAYVASSIGVVRVRIAGDTVGEFSLCARCDTRDIASTQAGRVVVATDEDVRVEDNAHGSVGDNAGSEFTLTDTGFGPATAIGVTGSTILAADPDGTVRFLKYERGDDGQDACRDSDWQELEFGPSNSGGRDERRTPTSVRAIDGDLLATDAGVYRFRETDGARVLEHAGLTDVVDVSAAAVPLAATADGLYRLGNGWMKVLEGTFETVTADPQAEPGRLSRAHAVTAGVTAASTAETAAETTTAEPAETDVYAFSNGNWERVTIEQVSDPIVDVGYGPRTAPAQEAATALESVYAVTESGTVLVSTTEPGEATAPDGWRQRSVGVTGVTGLAVRPD